MRMCLVLAAALFAACAHKPEVAVTVIHSGAFYPPLADHCPVQLLNGEHTAILVSGEFELLGFIMFAGASKDLERALSAIPGAVMAGVCKMGGDSVSIANEMHSQDAGTLQFAVWKARNPAPAAEPTPSPTSARNTT